MGDMSTSDDSEQRLQQLLTALSGLDGEWRASRLGYADRKERWEVGDSGLVRCPGGQWTKPSLQLLSGTSRHAPDIQPWQDAAFLELSGVKKSLVEVVGRRVDHPAPGSTKKSAPNVLRAIFAIADAKLPVTPAPKNPTPRSRDEHTPEAKAAAVAAEYITRKPSSGADSSSGPPKEQPEVQEVLSDHVTQPPKPPPSSTDISPEKATATVHIQERKTKSTQSPVNSKKRGRHKVTEPTLADDEGVTIDEVLANLPDFESLVNTLKHSRDPTQVYLDLPILRCAPVSAWLIKWVERALAQEPCPSRDQPEWGSLTTLIAVISFTFDLKDKLSTTMRTSLLSNSEFGGNVANFLKKTLKRSVRLVEEDQKKREGESQGRKSRRQVANPLIQDVLATCQDVMATIVSFLLWEKEDPEMFSTASWRPSRTVGDSSNMVYYISKSVSLLSCQTNKNAQRNFQNQLSEFLSFVLSPEQAGDNDVALSRAAYRQKNSSQLSGVLLRRFKEEPSLLKHHLTSPQFAKLLQEQTHEAVRQTFEIYLAALSRLVTRKTCSAALDEGNLSELDTLVNVFGIQEMRDAVVTSTALRAIYVSVVVDILRLTNELIDEEEKQNDDDAGSDDDDPDFKDRLDRQKRRTAFSQIAGRVFSNVFGDERSGEALLKSVVQDYYGGRRGVFRLVRIVHGIDERIATTDMFSKALERLNQVAASIETKQFAALVTKGGEVSESESESQGKTTSEAEKPDVALFRMPKAESLISAKISEFDLMTDEYKEFLQREDEKRKIREMGKGEQCAPFVQIEANLYILGAKKFRPSGVEDPPCHCLAVENMDRCNDKECVSRVASTECSSGSCLTAPGCQNQRFQKREYKKVKIFKASGKKGWGLRAQEEIKAGEFITEYVGEVIDQAEYERRKKEYRKEKNFYFMTLENGLYLDAARKGSICRFINHSCDPNAATQKWRVKGASRIGVFAVRDIGRHEEVCFDYKLQDESRALKSVVCECGTERCRGYLTGSGDAEEIEVISDHDSPEVEEVILEAEGRPKITNRTIEESINRAFNAKPPKPTASPDVTGSDDEKPPAGGEQNGNAAKRASSPPALPEPKKAKAAPKNIPSLADEPPVDDQLIANMFSSDDFGLREMKIPRKQTKG